jgi:hypothetical protein
MEDSKATATAARSADRQQFEALTNRLREAARTSQRFQKEVETRMINMEASVKQVRVCRAPESLLRLSIRGDDPGRDESSK